MRRAIKAHLGDFVALVVLFVIGIGVAAYIVANQTTRPTIPLLEPTPKILKAQLSTAQAVTPGQGQSVRVAGVQVGKITGVTLQNGVAVVTMQIEPNFWNKLDIRTDATALLRPKTGLKDMFIELDPGGYGTPVKPGYTIPVANTAPDVNPDQILSSLDTDTRQYLELLINSAGKGLAGRGNDLNLTFKALQPTTHDLRRIASAVAERQSDLRDLIHEYGDLTNALADTDGDIQRLVNSSDTVFRAFASQASNISLAVSLLPPTLEQTTSTLRKVIPYAPLLASTLNSLDPAFRELNVANHAVLPFALTATPIIKNQIRPFVEIARPYVRNLRPAAIDLAQATPDLTQVFHELNRLFNMLAYNPQPHLGNPTGNAATDAKRDQGYLFWLAWLGQNGNSLFSTSDAQGALRRYLITADCSSLRQITTPGLTTFLGPGAATLTGLTNPLNVAGLCPPGGGSSSSSPLPPLPSSKKGDTSPKAGAAKTKASGTDTAAKAH